MQPPIPSEANYIEAFQAYPELTLIYFLAFILPGSIQFRTYKSATQRKFKQCYTVGYKKNHTQELFSLPPVCFFILKHQVNLCKIVWYGYSNKMPELRV